MSDKRIKKSPKFIAFTLFLSVLLLLNSSCLITGEKDEAELIESLLQKVDAMDGEMSVVTKEGDNITITITKGSSIESHQVDDNTKDQTKGPEVDKDSPSSIDMSSILPSLEGIEDVFEVLGVWEDAHVLHEKGLSWSHVATELGYDEDTMYAELLEIAEERLKDAKASGLITYELFEKKFAYFGEIALKWVNKIFMDTDKHTVDLASILPSLESVEDVFEVLGVWEDAHVLHEKGLSWSHVATELGYDEDTMYAELLEIAEERLKDAKASGLITYELFEKKFAYFGEITLKWVNKIFTDTGEEEKEIGKFDGIIKVIDGDIWEIIDGDEVWVVDVSEAEIIRKPIVGLRAFIVGIEKDDIVVALEVEIEVAEEEETVINFSGIIKTIDGHIWKVHVEDEIRIVDVSEALIRVEPEIGLRVLVAGIVEDDITIALEVDEAEE